MVECRSLLWRRVLIEASSSLLVVVGVGRSGGAKIGGLIYNQEPLTKAPRAREGPPLPRSPAREEQSEMSVDPDKLYIVHAKVSCEVCNVLRS